MKAKFILCALLGLTAMTANAQRVVTIIELDSKPVSNANMQDPRTLVGNTIASETFSADGLFNFDRANIKNLHYRQNDFQKLANIAISGGYYVRVDAFADELGTKRYNQNLSQRRAKAVTEMLSKQYGIERSKISYTGWGEDYPIVTCDTSKEALRYERAEVVECLAPNRRVMVSVIKGE